MHELMTAPDFYKKPADELKTASENLKTLENQLESSMLRWEELSLLDN